MNNRIVILVELLLSVALFFVYTQPTYSNTIAGLNRQIAQTKTAQLAAKQYAGTESHLQTQFDQISSQDRARLDTFLPRTSLGVPLLYSLRTLATNSHFVLSNFSINQAQNATRKNKRSYGPSLRTLTVSLTGVGSYENFRSFLNGLEYSLRLMDVTSIKISATNNAFATGSLNVPTQYTYSLTFNVYWLSGSSKT